MRLAIVYAFLLSILATAAQSQNYPQGWKEYQYRNDRFSIYSPVQPDAHRDLRIEDMTAYTVHLPADGAVVTLRVSHDPRNCSEMLKQLKEGVLAGRQPSIDRSSVKEATIDGNRSVEYEFTANATSRTHDRYVCNNDQFYVFSIGWPNGRQMPKDAKRIMDSFRMLPTK